MQADLESGELIRMLATLAEVRILSGQKRGRLWYKTVRAVNSLFWPYWQQPQVF